MAKTVVGNGMSFSNLAFEDVPIFRGDGIADVEEGCVNAILFQDIHDLWCQSGINPIIKG